MTFRPPNATSASPSITVVCEPSLPGERAVWRWSVCCPELSATGIALTCEGAWRAAREAVEGGS